MYTVASIFLIIRYRNGTCYVVILPSKKCCSIIFCIKYKGMISIENPNTFLML